MGGCQKVELKVIVYIIKQGNLNLSRSLGDLEYKQNTKLSAEEQMITAFPEITQTTYTDSDFIFIGCDGVWDCKSNQEVADYINDKLKKNSSIKLSKILEDMLDEILAPDIYTGIIFCLTKETGVGCDNMTCVLIMFKKATKK